MMSTLGRNRRAAAATASLWAIAAFAWLAAPGSQAQAATRSAEVRRAPEHQCACGMGCHSVCCCAKKSKTTTFPQPLSASHHQRDRAAVHGPCFRAAPCGLPASSVPLASSAVQQLASLSTICDLARFSAHGRLVFALIPLHAASALAPPDDPPEVPSRIA